MSLQSKQWRVAPPVSTEDLSRFPDLPPLLVQLLHNRGLNDPAEAREFLEAQAPGHSPFALKGMYDAVGRLLEALRDRESIAVYGDFDADGVTATALLVQALSSLGAQVMPYIPSRVDEGYGLNSSALTKLHDEDGVRLVVTVDCGIRSIKEVEQVDPGMQLIVTDHHSVGDQLPPARAVINPNQPGCPYPFKDLSGVGVAYKLAQALFYARERKGKPADLTADDLLDLVALGTVADLVPLLGENRALVRRGLEKLNTSPRPGVEALMADAKVRRGEVDAAAIGFRLGPRLNAAGRLDQVMLAYNLLTSTDPLETRRLAQQLGKLNQHRQELTEKTVEIAEKEVRADPDAFLYLVASPKFKPGIVGLAASRLTEAHYRPSVVVEMGKKRSRGSCRSIPEFHITRALDQCQDLLVRHGGHAAAAGFTVETGKLDALRERLQAIAAKELSAAELQPVLEIDRELPLAEVGWETQGLLAKLEPTGMENPLPVLCSPGVEVRHRRTVGGDKHLKLMLRDGRGASWDAIWFRAGELMDKIPGRVDVAYTLEASEWNHRKRLQLHVVDMRPAQGSSVAEEGRAYTVRSR